MPPASPVQQEQGHRRQVRPEARSPPARTSSSRTRPGKSADPGPQRQVGEGPDPIRKALPDKIKVTFIDQRRRHRQASDQRRRRPRHQPTGMQASRAAPPPCKEHKANVDNPVDRLHPLRGLPAEGQAVRQHRLPQGRHLRAPTTSRSRPPAAARWPVATSAPTCCRRPSRARTRRTTRTASPSEASRKSPRPRQR